MRCPNPGCEEYERGYNDGLEGLRSAETADRARKDEREACAQLVEAAGEITIARTIRARSVVEKVLDVRTRGGRRFVIWADAGGVQVELRGSEIVPIDFARFTRDAWWQLSERIKAAQNDEVDSRKERS